MWRLRFVAPSLVKHKHTEPGPQWPPQTLSTFSRGSIQPSIPIRGPLHLLVLFLSFRVRLRGFARRKGLLKVRNDVVNVLRAYGYPDEIFRHTAVRLLLVAQLLVRCAPRVDRQGLRVADTVTW